MWVCMCVCVGVFTHSLALTHSFLTHFLSLSLSPPLPHDSRFFGFLRRRGKTSLSLSLSFVCLGLLRFVNHVQYIYNMETPASMMCTRFFSTHPPTDVSRDRFSSTIDKEGCWINFAESCQSLQDGADFFVGQLYPVLGQEPS